MAEVLSIDESEDRDAGMNLFRKDAHFGFEHG
jgi:hypothetical protein